ncbi:MAG: AP protein [Gemmatimonadales bacterium]
MSVFTLVGSSAAQSSDARVIVVTLDGMRWQEVFGGADSTLLFGRAGGVHDTGFVARRFWRRTEAERREALMPFFWTELARQGQVLGDPDRQSEVRVTNGLRFSYPGYNELFVGEADPGIDSNDKVPNPNLTVVEWLARMPAYSGRVAVYGSWDVFPYIFNVQRSGLPVFSLGEPVPEAADSSARAVNRMTHDLPTLWASSALDAPAMAGAFHRLQTADPGVLVVLLGETDEWAHDRRYDLYLDAAHRADRFLERLWRAVEHSPSYRGRTSLIVSTDHGRGGGADWTDHGRDVPAAERIWLAVMGPRTPALGVIAGARATQSQLAATLAALLGQSWQSARPTAAPPVASAIR